MIRGNYWWIYCRDDGVEWWHRARGVSEPLAKGSCKEISEVPAPDSAEFVLCVPGESVRIHRVRVPTRNRRKVIANINFALEDKLLHDADQYHLVPIIDSGKPEMISVAVISKSYLDEFIECFREREWVLRYLAPDYFYIPAPDDQSWLLDVSTVPFLLSMPDINSGSIITGELNSQAPGGLLLALESSPLPSGRLFVRVTDEEQAEQLASWSLKVNEQDVEIQIIKDQQTRQAWLARADLPQTGRNLLTGAYAGKDRNIGKFKRYIPVAGLAAVLMIFLLADWIISGLRLESEYTRLQSEIEETYLALFPDARNLSDPRFQMEQTLLNARQSAGNVSGKETGFLARLETVSGLIGGSDNQLQQLIYNDSGLTLEISVPDYESLEDLQSRLSREIPSKLDSAELKDGRVYARLVMEDGV